MIHETVALQVWVDIDVGIADLVRYLNTLPGVRTWASCQGESSGPEPYGPYVMTTWTPEALPQLMAEFDVEAVGNGTWGYVRPRASTLA